MSRSIPHIAIPAARRLAVPSLLALAAALSACGTTSQYAPREGYQAPAAREPARPNFPITQAAPGESVADAAAPVPGDSPIPSARPSGEVSAQPLPPPAAVTSQALPPPPPPPPPAASAYVAPPPPQMTTTTTTVTSVNGRVVDVGGKAEVYTIKSGDTLIGIARKLDTTQKALADDNNLEPPYVLRPGRTLKGPQRKAKAYVVASGDTMFAIARRFNVSAAAIAEANDIEVGNVRAGQRLELPQGFKDSGPLRRTVTTTVPVPGPAAAPVTTTTTVAAAPAYTPPATPYRPPVAAPPPPATTTTTMAAATPLPSRPMATTTTTTTIAPPRPGAPPVTTTTTTVRPATPAAALPTDAAMLTDAEIAAAGRGRFAWPVRGSVISEFGPKGPGQRNDGLNLRVPAGEPVKAAAAGEVVYAGDQVPGFGNLVLVKHDGGWVTAYAHLSRADVRMRQVVASGQQIGQAGATGGVPEPQLHFEVRYAPSVKDKARPIDPALVLPR